MKTYRKTIENSLYQKKKSIKKSTNRDKRQQNKLQNKNHMNQNGLNVNPAYTVWELDIRATILLIHH